jgi:small-conductance mechanosensitive channel
VGQGTRGAVVEIGLRYTWIRTRENDRLVVPNERLASETIRNSTIRSSESYAEATVTVPADAKLRQVVQALGADGDEVYVTDLVGENATVVVRKRISGEHSGDRASSDLRLWIADRLAGHAG